MKYTKELNNPFLYGLNVLDLHGETCESTKVLTKEFINDNVRMKENRILIIHGKGTGVVRKSVHDELKKNKNVLSFKTDNSNEGVTIIDLK